MSVGASGGAVADDRGIPDDEYVYRRVFIKHVHVVPGSRDRPMSMAFEDKEDGMSVFRRSELLAAGRTPADVLAGYEHDLLARLRVADLRHLALEDGTTARCGITPDPDPQGEKPHPCSGAHSLVHIPGGKARRRKTWKAMALRAEFVDPATGEPWP